MGKNLLIVESPAKAKTIEKYLGSDFTVKSSYGHIRDLEKGDKGVDVESDEGRYRVLATPRQGEMRAPVVTATEALYDRLLRARGIEPPAAAKQHAGRDARRLHE